MGRKNDVEFDLLHAAMLFIKHKGLTDEFLSTAANGQLCNETDCGHELEERS